MDAPECFVVGDLELTFASSNDVRVENGLLEVEIAAVAPTSPRPGVIELTAVHPQPVLRISSIAFPTPQCQVVHRIGRYSKGSNPGIWLDGFAAPLRFGGDITVQEGLLTVSGALYGDYGRGIPDKGDENNDGGEGLDPPTPLLLRRRFTPAAVDPAHFRHDSFESARSVASEFVHMLDCRAYSKPLPSELFSLTALRYLVLRDAVIDPAEPRFAALGELQWLSLQGGQMQALPASITQLAQLQTLQVNGTGLMSVPASLFEAPRLETLDLQYNKLQSLPDVSPAKRLRRLALKGNAFRTLPRSLAGVPQVEIESKFKRLFQDTPARKRVAFDPKTYAAAHDAAWLQQIDAALERESLQRFAKPIRQLARKAVAFATTSPELYASTGNTRFGGEPDLPASVPYPQHGEECFIFIAQIELSEIASLQDYLPRSGLLSFFVSDLEHVAQVRVLLHDADTALQRTSPPPEASFDQGPFAGFLAEASSACDLPSLYGAEARLPASQKVLLKVERDDALNAAYERVRVSLAPQRTADDNHCHGINRHVFVQGESMEETAAQRGGGKPGDWAVLLTVGFDRNTGFCFWDAGTLSFMIDKHDLAAQDFSRVIAMIESS
jgi:uncharacterized protein YwqG